MTNSGNFSSGYQNLGFESAAEAHEARDSAQDQLSEASASVQRALEALTAAKEAGAPADEVARLQAAWERADNYETRAMSSFYSLESELDPDWGSGDDDSAHPDREALAGNAHPTWHPPYANDEEVVF